MTIMLTEVYDAFLAAKVPEEKARRAAEAVAAFENRFASIERRLTVLEWMSGTTLAGIAALLVHAYLR